MAGEGEAGGGAGDLMVAEGGARPKRAGGADATDAFEEVAFGVADEEAFWREARGRKTEAEGEVARPRVAVHRGGGRNGVGEEEGGGVGGGGTAEASAGEDRRGSRGDDRFEEVGVEHAGEGRLGVRLGGE